MGESSNGRGAGFGLIAAAFTAFSENGSLELPRIEEQAQALREDGLRGVFVCGTTGEGASLSSAERARVTERWRGAAGGLEVIAHVGHTSLAEARSLARHAESVGVDGIAAVAPYYHRPRDLGELVSFCAELAEAAPSTPFYYYHIPSMTGVDLPAADFLAAADGEIPTLSGVKFTSQDLADYGRCLQAAGDRYEIFFGRDEMLLAALSLGASSAVGSTYNFGAPLYRAMSAAFGRGDLEAAREAQSLAREAIESAVGHGGLAALKAIMPWCGVDCGPCRSPLRTLDAAAQKHLRGELEKMGFFQRIEKARGAIRR